MADQRTIRTVEAMAHAARLLTLSEDQNDDRIIEQMQTLAELWMSYASTYHELQADD